LVSAEKLDDDLVSILSGATAAGRAQWVRRTPDLEFTYCFLAGELLVFTTYGDDAAPAAPTERLHGVTATVRNIQLLWLEGLNGWDDLLAMLRAAPVDDERYARLYEDCCEVAVKELRSRAAGTKL
jgi:hypothetical protein